MASTAVDPTAPETMEQKILLATQEAEQVASVFSPAVGQAIQMGVAIEPVIKGYIALLAGIFHHHTKAAATPEAA